MPKSPPTVPIAVRRALVTLGADISAARRRRRLPLEVVAERALTTRQTIARIEHGDPRVAMGTWATVLFALGLADRLRDLAAPGRDEVGLALEDERLPIRVRIATGVRPTRSITRRSPAGPDVGGRTTEGGAEPGAGKIRPAKARPPRKDE